VSFLWTDAEVRSALGLKIQRAAADSAFSEICTDSRKVQPEALFVALVGDRFDGHDFVMEALARGATGVIASRTVDVGGSAHLYPVADTLRAYGDLALHRRRKLNATVVGITGSAGKTMVKDLLSETLRGSFRVHATPGNLNNRIGLPQTLLQTSQDAQVLILEMGTNEPGEIRTLAEIARPSIGLISTVSETHLEKLGSVDGVMEEKLDLLRGLTGEAVAVVGDEPPELAERARRLVPEVRVAGWSDRADPELRPLEAEATDLGCYRFRYGGERIQLRIPGRHAVANALLALAVAEGLGVHAKDAGRRISKVSPGAMRSEIRTLGSLTLLADCYNASPQSVRAALDILVGLQQLGPRVAVLGSMLELGEASRILHRQVLEEALSRPLDLVVATGLFAEAARWISPPAEGPELVSAAELDEAGRVLLERLGGAELVLLKGSRGVAMERLIPALEERFGNTAPRLTGKGA
jgi:UDP-N-acetylmuramoyl-tripeptide--D-alanyl-D-alanine ligase